jgi:excisionase family DNA binding protein
MKFLTPSEVAEKLGVSKSLVYQWVEEKRLSAYRLGGGGRRGRILVDEADLGVFLASCRADADERRHGFRFTHRRP